MRLNGPARFAPLSPPSPSPGESSLYSTATAPRVALVGVNDVPVPGKYRRSATSVVLTPGQYVYVSQYDLAVPPGRWTFQYMINYTTTYVSADDQFVAWGIYLSGAATWMSMTTLSEAPQVGSFWDAPYISAWISASGQDNFVLFEGYAEVTETALIQVACNTAVSGDPTVTIRPSSTAQVMPVTA